MSYLIAAVMGYILGTSSMALYLSKLQKVNLRAGGSGNLGASNTVQLMGWKAGILVALHDIGKSVLAVLLAQQIFPDTAYIGAVAGVCSVLGHIFPVTYKFKGGKGVSTTYGALAVINIWSALIVGALHLILIKTTGVVSISTIISFVVLPFAIFFLGSGEGYINVIMTAIITVIVIFAHRENIKRLIKGEENSFKKEK